jgi:beta-glucosidase-like glycosyl hydrolase
VARLSFPFTVFPGNRKLGNAFEKSKKDNLTSLQAAAMAKELKAVGINLNFTPVADIDTNLMGARVAYDYALLRYRMYILRGETDAGQPDPITH